MKPRINDDGIKCLLSPFIITLLLFTLLFTGCSQQAAQPAPEPPEVGVPIAPVSPPPSPGPSTPVRAVLAVSEPPLLDKAVQLTATFTVDQDPRMEIQSLDVELILPDGFQLVEGSLFGKVNVLRDKPTQFQATVKAVKVGQWDIEVMASYPFPIFVGGRGSAFAVLYAYISEDSATVSDIPLGPTIGHGGPAEPPPGWKPPPGYEDITPLPPSEPPKIEPPAQDVPPVDVQEYISSDFRSESGEKDFNDPLNIYGGFKCWISENSLTPSGQVRDDETWQMAWGGINVYNATTDELLGQVLFYFSY